MKTSNRRKVVAFSRDERMYKLTLECGHTVHQLGRAHEPPKTGVCTKCPNTCGAKVNGRTAECQKNPGHTAAKGRNAVHEDAAGYRWPEPVALGDIGPVLGDS